MRDEIRHAAHLQAAVQVADLSTLLGFKGNYAIFPLYQSNALTDFMMEPYIDRATGQLVDPSDPLNWSLDEFSDYVCCLRKQLTDDEFTALQPQLQTAVSDDPDQPVAKRRRAGGANELAVHRGAAGHAHAAREVQARPPHDRCQEGAGRGAREGARKRPPRGRILSDERGDPNIDKKILIEGTNNPIVVPAGEP